MKDILISILRNKKTTREEFRNAAEKLGLLLALQTSEFLNKKNIKIQTPFAKTEGTIFKNNVILISILRSGIALIEPFLHFYPQASVGFFGIRRDEKTAKPTVYYRNIPPIKPHDNVIILDPTIATGGSGSAALTMLIESGITEKQITFAAIIVAKKGITTIKNNFPRITILALQQDPQLNTKKFIIPGIGDFGDRYFGTE